MKTFEIKTLLFVAAVACLPIACGTNSVTGPDAASLVGPESTVSALHHGDPLPPTAPPPTGDPGAGTTPISTDDQVPEPSHQPAPGTDPSETDPHGLPGVSPDSGPVPPSAGCLAASIEFVMPNLFASTPGLALEAMLFDEKHVAITDDSCEKLDWRVEAADGRTGAGANDLATITYGVDSRSVSVTGPAGLYKIGVMAPNGTASSRLIELQ